VINWPSSLVREVAARRCAFFLGAGVSASAADAAGKHPKTWHEFLVEACGLISNPSKKATVENLVGAERYLLALQGIREYVDPADYRNLLDAHFNSPAFQPSEIHKCVYQLDSRIVITTNFDKIYERYCLARSDTGAFKVIQYDSKDLADELRSDTRLIIKAHGSIDTISRMIFTRAEYHRIKAEHQEFYDILKAIFLTHAVVFFGCGLDDPDVLLLLEEVKITSSSAKPHYAVIKEDTKTALALSDWKNSYNICALEYGPTHDDLIQDLQALLALIDEERATTVT
jgi:hypothetical protein